MSFLGVGLDKGWRRLPETVKLLQERRSQIAGGESEPLSSADCF